MSSLINAYVNHGRWVADCPACNSAAVVTVESPYFRCGCGLRAGVQFPPEREAIEDVLGRRPMAENRNWSQGESVADLRIENALHRVVA